MRDRPPEPILLIVVSLAICTVLVIAAIYPRVLT